MTLRSYVISFFESATGVSCADGAAVLLQNICLHEKNIDKNPTNPFIFYSV